MNKVKLLVIGGALVFGMGCGSSDKAESLGMIEVNTSDLSEEAKIIVEEVTKETQENIAVLEENAEASKESIKEKTKALKEALEAMDKEFETNE
ncbi:MAG: hypothetical protein JKY42_04970 [Flavobacteriales bacterium]|nr:hypothetical protein [Flavobacteriales bacterium]